jgi:transposase-like protein
MQRKQEKAENPLKSRQLKFQLMNLLNKLKLMVGVSEKKKSLPPVLIPKYCPHCGSYMEKKGFGNLAILRETNMAIFECASCENSYHSLTGFSTENRLVADKCKEKGFKVESEFRTYYIRNKN